jgi:hypothetical protein
MYLKFLGNPRGAIAQRRATEVALLFLCALSPLFSRFFCLFGFVAQLTQFLERPGDPA